MLTKTPPPTELQIPATVTTLIVSTCLFVVFRQRVIYSVGNWHAEAFKEFEEDMDCGITNWLLKFADDAKLFGKVHLDMDNITLQEDLQRLCDWAKEWQMEFSISKCKVMHIGNSSSCLLILPTPHKIATQV